MAQYYNFVTNASGTFTLEEVQRICCVNGQSVQFVVEDVNNGSHASSQLLTYTAVPENNQQAIISQQTVNFGSQIPPSHLEQRQNVFIIKTDEISGQHTILKTAAVNTQAEGDNIVNFVNSGVVETNTYLNPKTLTNCNNGAQTEQWKKMQENISINTISKQNVLITEKVQTAGSNKSRLQYHTSPSGYRDSQEFSTAGIKRKPFRLHQSKSRLTTNSTQAGLPSTNSANIHATTVVNSNDSGIRVSTPPMYKKAVGPGPQNVTRNSTQQDTLKQMQNSGQVQNDHRLPQSNIQRQTSNTLQQASMNNSFQQQSANTLHQRQSQTSTIHVQGKQLGLKQIPSSNNMHSSTDIESHEVESQEKNHEPNQQSSPTAIDSESNATESFAYLQKVIDNPSNTIVQHQIQGHTAKMLVILSNGEQRLITFDIPNEDCTVQDLLEQANITFCGETSVSLVSDTTLGINYIVEAGAGSIVIGHDGDINDATAMQDSMNSSLDTSTTTSAPDENTNPMQQNEEPTFVEGKLAVCSHCGFSSLDFNRCQRCKTKLPKDVKSVPMRMGAQEKKQNMSLSVDTFYRKNNDRNSLGRSERIERDGSMSKRGRGRGRCMANKPRPIHKEPECLTISSDEEEDGEGKRGDIFDNSTLSSNASNSFSEEMDSILGKEPVITSNSVSSVNNDYSPPSPDSAKDNTMQSPYTAVICRTVRIGSYKYVPQENVSFTPKGIRFGVPLLEDDKTFVKLDVKYPDVVKILVHFGKSTPVLFIYTTTNTGAMIREVLGMQDPKGPYYDPIGKDFTHKRITLLPEKLTEESKLIIKNLLSSRQLLEELNAKEANDLLVRASPKDSAQMQSFSSRRLSQSSSFSASILNTTNGAIQTITVYPPPPAKGGIAINTEDYSCLGEDQFLNDVIIDFYLKYLTLEVLSEADQQRTHVFSSYFYKRLTSPHTQAVESNVPLSAAAKRHARVQKWTKNVNIFEKDFIIIPINEHAHWFLAIICFPGLAGNAPPTLSPVKESEARNSVQRNKKLKEVKLQSMTIGNTTITPVTTTITIDQVDDSSERDEAEGDDEEMEVDSDDDEPANESETIQTNQTDKETLQQKDTVKQPCILIFDSLAGASRARVVATLRDYLSCEHVAKMGTEKVFSKDTIKGASLKVPQQSNFTDCGLYVLQYVESFFKDPIRDYTLPIKTLKNWFEEIVVTRKREELSKLLIKLMNATKGDKNINLPAANFPTQDGKLKAKPESNAETKPIKPDVEPKQKPAALTETRVSSNMAITTEHSELPNELFNTTTYSLIPYSPSTSSNSSESNQAEISTETTATYARSSSDTMSYLKSKRIARLVRTDNHEQSQAAKKHKGEFFNSCK